MCSSFASGAVSTAFHHASLPTSCRPASTTASRMSLWSLIASSVSSSTLSASFAPVPTCEQPRVEELLLRLRVHLEQHRQPVPEGREGPGVVARHLVEVGEGLPLLLVLGEDHVGDVHGRALPASPRRRNRPLWSVSPVTGRIRPCAGSCRTSPSPSTRSSGTSSSTTATARSRPPAPAGSPGAPTREWAQRTRKLGGRARHPGHQRRRPGGHLRLEQPAAPGALLRRARAPAGCCTRSTSGCSPSS